MCLPHADCPAAVVVMLSMACPTVSRRFLFKLGALLFILVLYVFGAAFYSGLRLWQRPLTFDGDVRRLLNRSTWDVVDVLVAASRLEKTTLTLPACPIISPHLSKLLFYLHSAKLNA